MARSPAAEVSGPTRRLVQSMLLATLVVSLAQCGDAPPDSPVDDPEASPAAAAEPWLDLRREPFHPEWVAGTLRIAHLTKAPGTLNPLAGNFQDWRTLHRLVLNPALLIEGTDPETGRVQHYPAAAGKLPEWEDENTLVFSLREGLTWSGGDARPLTSKDVVFTWNMLQHDTPWARDWKSDFPDVEEIRALDEQRFAVRFKERTYSAAILFGRHFPIVPEHASPSDPIAFAKLERLPMYGAFEFVSMDEGALRVALRPEYRVQPHPIDRWYHEAIEWHFIAQAELKKQRFLAGELDLITASKQALEDIANQASDAPTVLSYEVPTQTLLIWSNRDPADATQPHPILGDPKVRRAFTMLLDRRRLSPEAIERPVTFTTVPWSPSDQGTDPEVVPIPFDPKAAAALLDEAGWKRGDSGVREKEGVPMALTLTAPDGVPSLKRILTRVAEVLRQAGVRTSIQLKPSNVWIKEAVAHQLEVTCFFSSSDNPVEEDLYSLLHSSSTVDGSNNWAGLRDAEMDRLLEEARRTFDLADRTRIRRAIHRRFHELVPYTLLGIPRSQVVISARIANAKAHPYGIRYQDMVQRDRISK